MSTNQATDPSAGLLSRLSAPVFWALALGAGLLGAAVLAVAAGLIADAITGSSSIAGLAGLVGAVVGFVAPVLILRSRRGASKSPDSRREPPNLSAQAADEQERNERPIGQQDASGPSDWFYAEGGRRVGPVSAGEIHGMIAAGTLSRSALVWRKGMADWAKISESELSDLAAPSAPPPLSPTGIANGYIWALALAPFWGEILHYIGVYFYLALRGRPRLLWDLEAQLLIWKTWYFSIALNCGLAFADQAALSSAGWKGGKLNKWLAILVPIYIYKRDQLVGANMTRFWVWLGAALVSVLVI